MDRKLQLGCNNDAMLQSGKGVMGVRVDGVRGAKLANLDIYNLVSETAPGSAACGEYTSFEPNPGPLGGGHMAQRQPMQVGFSGNSVQGVALNAADAVELTRRRRAGARQRRGGRRKLADYVRARDGEVDRGTQAADAAAREAAGGQQRSAAGRQRSGQAPHDQ